MCVGVYGSIMLLLGLLNGSGCTGYECGQASGRWTKGENQGRREVDTGQLAGVNTGARRVLLLIKGFLTLLLVFV